MRLAAILLAVPLSAQVLLNPPRPASVISVDVELVNVVCAVRDRSGAYIKNLQKEDFEVREEGQRREIAHFARETDTALTVSLLLDVSGSVSRILDIEKAAAARFFREVLAPKDRAMLVGFGQMIAVWQDLTSSVPDLEAALENANAVPDVRTGQNAEFRRRGGTLLWDAVNLVARNKLRRQEGRKVIVAITDGLDLGSIASFETAARAAQEADAVVYGVHYQDEGRRGGGESGMTGLRKLAEPTGGRAFHVSSKLPLEYVFDTIREEMRSQYGIGFKPASMARDGAWRRLQVKAKPGMKVQARTGYFAVNKK